MLVAVAAGRHRCTSSVAYIFIARQFTNVMLPFQTRRRAWRKCSASPNRYSPNPCTGTYRRLLPLCTACRPTVRPTQPPQSPPCPWTPNRLDRTTIRCSRREYFTILRTCPVTREGVDIVRFAPRRVLQENGTFRENAQKSITASVCATPFSSKAKSVDCVYDIRSAKVKYITS